MNAIRIAWILIKKNVTKPAFTAEMVAMVKEGVESEKRMNHHNNYP